MLYIFYLFLINMISKERLQELLIMRQDKINKSLYLKEAYKQRPALERPPKAEWWNNKDFEEQRYDLVECAVRYTEIKMKLDKIKKFILS